MRLLPEGGNPDPLNGTGLARYLAAALKHARAAGQLTLDPPPASCGGTPTRSSPSPADGLAGQLTARAEAHTIRLALLYALLDGATPDQDRAPQAALALWDYAARSAAWALDHTDRRPARRTDPRRAPRSPTG